MRAEEYVYLLGYLITARQCDFLARKWRAAFARAALSCAFRRHTANLRRGVDAFRAKATIRSRAKALALGFTLFESIRKRKRKICSHRRGREDFQKMAVAFC